MLKVEGLTKKYGKFTAVNELSFVVDEGAIFGFVGPNGAGKTSTLKILATLMRPTSGRAWIAGEEISANPRKIRSLVGYMPDFFGVYDDLKVEEYLNFYGASYKIPVPKRKKIIDELLELVDLSHKRNAYVDSLSRGMKQRLCLARSLVHDPALLILDEPASGLDPRARFEVREILKELKSMGKTIIISSHVLPELSEICTHIGIIEAGQMVITGTVEEIMCQSMTSNALQVKVLNNLSQAEEILKEMGLSSIKIEDRLLEVPFVGSDEQKSEVLRELINGGVSVVSFADTKGDLEDLFMQVTKGVVQ